MLNKILLLFYRIIGNKKKINNLRIKQYKKMGMKIGRNFKCYSDINIGEPYLIEIGNDVTISNNVKFITHDNSVIKMCNEYTDLFGKIKIGDNCFIGYGSLIMPGVIIADNVIIGAGSVVTKSIKDNNVIIAGNPASIISTFDKTFSKVEKYCHDLRKINCDKRTFIENLSDERMLVK